MKRLSLSLCIALLAAPAAQAGFQEARQAFIDGKYEVAYRELVPLANAGDPRSQIGMGLLHAKGLGVDQDNVQAYAWFERVLEQDQQVNPILRTLATTNRDYLARNMSAEELEDAEKLVEASLPGETDMATAETDHMATEVAEIATAAAAPAKAAVVPTVPYSLHAALPVQAQSLPAIAVETQADRQRHGIRIQLAAYKLAARAKVLSAWERIRSSQPAILGKLEPSVTQVDLGERGAFQRLQAGPFADIAAATKACVQLRAAHQDCFVVEN